MMTTGPHGKPREEARERERRERSLEIGLEDSMAASDPVAAVQPAPAKEPDSVPLRIVKHDKSDIVELSDGSRWRVWPGDISTTLRWLPTTELRLSAMEDELCSHVLISTSDRSRTRVIDASRDWPVEKVRRSLRDS